MGYKNYCVISGILFSLVALAHLSRVVMGLEVTVGNYAVPMYVSWFGLLVPAGLAVWAFRSAAGGAG